MPILFPTRLGKVFGVVLRPDGDQLRLLFIQDRRNINTKRGMSTFMVSHELTVNPHTRTIVHSSELEQHSSLTWGHVKFTLVPTVGVKPCITNPATGRFRSKRHLYGMRPLSYITGLNELPLVVKTELPPTVQTFPAAALQLWSRICRFSLAKASPSIGITGYFDLTILKIQHVH
jgi:hypothetical protein